MITAVDTNVLIDFFFDEPDFGDVTARALQRCAQEGQLIVSDIVFAEFSSAVRQSEIVAKAMDEMAIEFVPMGKASCTQAGKIFRVYKQRGGKRDRMIPDFLIGAHAKHHADRLLTRDRGFYRAYFRGLAIVDPSVNPSW
jgi:hypothetical protein